MVSEAENNLKFIGSKIQELNATIIEASKKGCPNGDRKCLETFERTVRLLTSELADWIAAEQLQQLLVREDANFKIKELIQRRKLVNHGLRRVMVRLSGGTRILFVVSYWVANKKDKRGKREKGLYPALLFFGVYDHCSPLLLAEIAQSCVALGSMEEAQRLLAERGNHLDIKTIRNSVKRFARRARAGQKALSQMIFADDKLNCNIVELLDMYHAVQHLYVLSERKKSWTRKKRARWINEQKQCLKKGNIEKFIGALEIACRGAKSTLLRRELECFCKHRERMTYATRKALHMPMGSGAIESAIRRVINLRLKSPCIFWHEDTVSEILLLRSYFKACRWGQLKTMAYHGGFCDAA